MFSVKKSEQFYVRKWYMDLVTPQNEKVIIYFSEMKFQGFYIHGTAYYYFDKFGKKHEGTDYSLVLPMLLIPDEKIKAQDNIVRFISQKFVIDAKWTLDSKPYTANIYAKGDKYINWECNMPLADVNMRIGDEYLAGRGYVDSLTFNIPPWEFPFTHILWGRFLSTKNSVVWIDFAGGNIDPIGLVNGVECLDDFVVSDNNFLSERGNIKLEFSNKMQIRDMQLIEMLRSIPAYERLVPKSFYTAHNKQLTANGLLHFGDGKVESGNIITEYLKLR